MPQSIDTRIRKQRSGHTQVTGTRTQSYEITQNLLDCAKHYVVVDESGPCGCAALSNKAFDINLESSTITDKYHHLPLFHQQVVEYTEITFERLTSSAV